VKKVKSKKEASLEKLFSRLLKPEKRQRLELLLLKRLKHRKADLEKMFGVMIATTTADASLPQV